MYRQLLPIGTKVILNDLYKSDFPTVITGHRPAAEKYVYEVRGPSGGIYPAAENELTPVEPVAQTRAEKLLELARETGEVREAVLALQDKARHLVSGEDFVEALGDLARAKNRIAGAAGQEWAAEKLS